MLKSLFLSIDLIEEICVNESVLKTLYERLRACGMQIFQIEMIVL